MAMEEKNDEVLPSLIYAIGRVDQGIRRELRRELAECDLSLPEFIALSVLERRPNLSNAQLARRTMVTPQSMHQILFKLEERGLVTREADPNHARIRRVSVSPEGASMLADIRPAIESIESRVFAAVPRGRRDALRRAMMSAMDELSRGGGRPR